jgi:hypothetical protein
MKNKWIRNASVGVLVVLTLVILDWIVNLPTRRAKRITPGTPFQSVVKSLGEPTNEKQESGMILYWFKPSYIAAGPIRVGFDKANRAVYLKIYEDSPPQWDLRITDKTDNGVQSIPEGRTSASSVND